MPINEYGAASITQVKYKQPTVNRVHTFRFYLDAQVQADEDGALVVGDYSESIHDIVVQLFTRASHDTAFIPEYTVISVESWNTQAGDNSYVGEDTASYASLGYTGSSFDAAAYYTFTFKTSQKRPWRFTLLDTGKASPDAFEMPNPPDADDLSLAWYILKSPINFVNNDGIDLTLAGTATRGVNNYSARRYGKVIAQ